MVPSDNAILYKRPINLKPNLAVAIVPARLEMLCGTMTAATISASSAIFLSLRTKWGQTLIIDLIRLYFCLISDCLDISDLTMFALRLTAEYVRPNNSPICLFVYKPVPLKK